MADGVEKVVERCRWVRFFSDYVEVCHGGGDAPKAKEAPKQEDGTILGWLVCTMASSSYTEGCSYDWQDGNCECRGDFRPPQWRR